MSSRSQMHSKPRARPVAEAPVIALLAREEELATRWAVGLMLARPLERVAEIPWATVAREAPGLCAQAVRALESDTEVQRMIGGDGWSGGEDFSAAHTLAALAGAEDAESIVHAVEALRGVLWVTLMDEMQEPTAREVADLADRLAYVCAMIAAAAIAARTAAHEAAALRAARQAIHAPEAEPAGGEHAVLIDEWQGDQTAPAPGPGSQPPIGMPEAPRMSEERSFPAAPSPWDTPLPDEIRVARAANLPAARLDERA